MAVRIFRRMSFLFLLLVLLPPAAFAKLRVFVSIPPQKYFVQRVGGDLVQVDIMVPAGASPHTYEPKPRQMAAISQADIYFTIGVEFESAWMRRFAAANPRMRIVDTAAQIRRIPISGHHHHDEPEHDGHGHEQHGQEGAGDRHDEEHQAGLDPHIWLSPPLVKQQAAAILAALQAADPRNAPRYLDRHDRFVADLEALDGELKEMFSGRQRTRFLVFHPSWGYFAEAYDLEQVAVEVEGKSPKPAQLQEIIERMRTENIRVIFVQPQFSDRSAKLIARSIDGEVVSIDPLAEEWLENMRHVAGKFRQALR